MAAHGGHAQGEIDVLRLGLPLLHSQPRHTRAIMVTRHGDSHQSRLASTHDGTPAGGDLVCAPHSCHHGRVS